MMDDPSAADWVQAIATIALVIITSVYVYLTHRLSKESKENRELTPLPVLTCSVQDLRPEGSEIAYLGATSRIAIRNVGNAPALAVEIKVWLANRNESGILLTDTTVNPGTLEPSMNHEFDLEGSFAPNPDHMGKYELPKLRVATLHQNAFGRQFTTKTELQLNSDGYWSLIQESRNLE